MQKIGAGLSGLQGGSLDHNPGGYILPQRDEEFAGERHNHRLLQTTAVLLTRSWNHRLSAEPGSRCRVFGTWLDPKLPW